MFIHARGIPLKKLKEQGALRKALIFTESTKTQAFLREYLEANGYEGKGLLFNGKASEPQTNEIYKRWCIAHPDSVSGIKAADRRAAAVDYFKNEADIMIATEATAEGLYLTQRVEPLYHGIEHRKQMRIAIEALYILLSAVFSTCFNNFISIK